jgi:hypothetical protein
MDKNTINANKNNELDLNIEVLKLILQSNDYNKLIDFDMNTLINQFNETKEERNIIDLLNSFIFYSDSDSQSDYKLQSRFKFYDYLVNLIVKINVDIESLIFFMKSVSIVKKGNIILDKIVKKYNFFDIFKNDKNKKTYFYINPVDIINKTSSHGTLINFLWWEKRLEKEQIQDTNIISLSFRNSDDRIYKYIIKNSDLIDNKDPTYIIKNLDDTRKEILFDQIIVNSFSHHIPEKYSMRRIKFISKYVNLSKYINQLISNACNYKSIKILLKYYYNNFDNSITNIECYENLNLNIFDSEECLIHFYSQLKSDYEKNLLIIIRYNCGLDISYFRKNDKLKVYIEFWQKDIKKNTMLVSGIFNSLAQKFYNLQSKNNENKYFLSDKNEYLNSVYILRYLSNFGIFYKNNFMDKFLSFRTTTKFLFFILPFFKYINSDKRNIILGNRLTYHFRLLVKNWRKRNLINRKIHFYSVLNEVVNFKPNPKVNVLKYGSVNYNLGKQRFSKIPPYHLHYNEIYYLNNYLVRMKADGILTYNLPIEIYPGFSDLKNYQIKAEFIDELDLYLVFDIDIPNMSIVDRYMFLRRNHFYTRNTNLKNVSSYDELKEEIKSERRLFSNFLDEPYDNYRWYPKASWNVKNSSNDFSDEIINNVILENDKEFICDNNFHNNDGLILVPINGKREIKVKPRSEMTIDLLFKDNKWVDREGNNFTNIVENNKKVSNNTIWRLYPNKNNKFDIGDFRYDKKNPNPNYIVNMILKFINFNWGILSNTKVYYQKNKVPKEKFIKIIKNNKIIFDKMLLKMKPKKFSNWIDFGSGTGKVFKSIKKYEPNKYLGMDMDLNNCIKSIQKFCYNLNNKNYFIPVDLTKDWNDYELNWYKFDFTKKYDYLICNFSISHFFVNKFWEQVNLISKNGTKMMFNIINKNAMKKFEMDKSYLYIDNDVVRYYFDHVHKNEIIEKFVSEELLNKTLEKYDWSITNKYQEAKGFESYYTWYIIQKN